jgi:hypothetical protein
MKVKYDVDNNEMVRGGGYKYWQERGTIADFIGSSHSNVVFEYDSYEETRAVATALERYIRYQKLPVKLMQRKNKVIIIRKDTEA